MECRPVNIEKMMTIKTIKENRTKREGASVALVLLMLATAAGVTVTGIIFKQDIWRMLPLYVSLVIAFMNSRVNRYAPLVGGFNSVLYALVYLSYGLCSSAAYAFFVSMPLQMVTFARWNKKPLGNSTELRRLKAWQMIMSAVLFAAGLACLCCATKNVSQYFLLDNIITALGILATVLRMMSYIEFTYLGICSDISSVLLYTLMLGSNSEQSTYLIFSLYSLVCSVMAVIFAERNMKSGKRGES